MKKRKDKEYRFIFIFVTTFLILSLISFSNNLTGFIVSTCIDSDEGDQFIGGTLSFQNFNIKDSCIDKKNVEYFCNKDGKPSVKLSECEFGCETDHCIKKGTSTNSEEIFRIKRGSDILEIGENIGDVIESVTESEMPNLLKSSEISAKGKTRYSQYLRFKDSGLTTGKVKLDENEEGEVEDFLFYDKDKQLFEYELEFENSLNSIISNNKLEDLQNEKINILGGEYEIVDSSVSGNLVELKFSGGKSKQELIEGQSKKYIIGGKEYNIKLKIVSGTKTIFEINGKTTKELKKGESDEIDGLMIIVTNVFDNEASEGNDFVNFYLGGMAFKFKDDISDDSFRQGIEVNGKLISEGNVKIKGEKTASEVKISNIKYRTNAKGIKGGDVFVSAGQGLKNSISQPLLFLGDWDITYKGLSQGIEKIKSSTILFNPSGSRYKLTFTNLKGRLYSIPLVSNNAGTLTIGDKDDALYFLEASSTSNFIVEKGDYFILTNKNDRTGITNVLRYRSISVDNNQLSFVDLGEGGKEVIYKGTPGTDAIANLVVSGKTYKVYIGPSPDYKIAIDLNGNGNVNSDEVKIVSNGGGILDLGSSQTPGGNFNMVLTTESKQFAKRTTDENINIEIEKDGSEVNAKLSSQTDLTLESLGGGEKEGLSNFGVKFLLTEKSGPDKLLIEYPGAQAEADVSIISY
ncbi:hypothetical protein HY498_03110 [Candidatus Woesearchaeota archaeon]|nr:hypothetical protein [Candidatus Woesearchaeota archaeon]